MRPDFFKKNKKKIRMNKYVSLVLAVIIAADVVMSFINDKAVENVFGIEMNVWVYRFLWSALAFFLVKGYLKQSKIEKTTKK